MKINDILKNIRKREGITQKRLAELLGISHNHISNIENGRKSPSSKLLEKVVGNFNATPEELACINAFKKDKKDNRTKKSKLKVKEENLIAREKLVNETYSMLRENNLVMSKVASIQLKLIEINNLLDKEFNEIEFSILGDSYDREVLEKLKRPFKTTVKRLENKIKKIKYLSDLSYEIEVDEVQGGKMSEFNYLNNYAPPISALTKEHRELAIQTYISRNLRHRWKDYIIDDEHPTPHSNRLWGGGRGTIGKKGFMANKIEEDIKLQVLSADNDEEVKEVFREIGEDLISRSVVVAEMLLKDARNAKTQAVRDKYNKVMHDDSFLLNLLKICVHLYATGLVDAGQKLPSLSLQTKVEALKQHRKKIDKIWRLVSRGELTFEEALDETESITNYYEKISLDDDQLQRIGQERMILQWTGEENVKGYMIEIMNVMVNNFKQLNMN